MLVSFVPLCIRLRAVHAMVMVQGYVCRCCQEKPAQNPSTKKLMRRFHHTYKVPHVMRVPVSKAVPCSAGNVSCNHADCTVAATAHSAAYTEAAVLDRPIF